MLIVASNVLVVALTRLHETHLLQGVAPNFIVSVDRASPSESIIVHIADLAVRLKRRVDDRVGHDGGVVREHPDLHLFGLVRLDGRNKRWHLAPVHGVTIQSEACLVVQVTRHRLEIVLRGGKEKQ